MVANRPSLHQHCVVSGLSTSGVQLRDGLELPRCYSLLADWELWPGSKGIGPLADALLGLRKHLQSGERVYLRSLELRNLQLDVHSIRRLANSIGGSSTGGGSSSSCGPALQLSDLALHNNGLRPTDVAALAKLCTNMPSLASLRITSSDIGDEGARELDAMLQARRTRRLPLRALALRDAGVGVAGMRALLSSTLHVEGGDVPSSPSSSSFPSSSFSACFNLSLSLPGHLPGHHALPSPSRLLLATRQALAPSLAARTRAQGKGGMQPYGGGVALGFAGTALGNRGVSRLTALLLRHASAHSYAYGQGQAPGERARLVASARRGNKPDAVTQGGMLDAAAASKSRRVTPSSSSSPSLVAINFRNVQMGGAGARALAHLAARLPRLRRLDASANDQVDMGGFAALLSLTSHPSLVSLRLPAPPLPDTNVTASATRSTVTATSSALSAVLSIAVAAPPMRQAVPSSPTPRIAPCSPRSPRSPPPSCGSCTCLRWSGWGRTPLTLSSRRSDAAASSSASTSARLGCAPTLPSNSQTLSRMAAAAWRRWI